MNRSFSKPIARFSYCEIPRMIIIGYRGYAMKKRKLEQKAIEGPPARCFSLLVTSDNKENTRGEARERRGCRSSCRPIEFGLLYKSVEREPRVSDHRVFLYTRRILHSRPEAIPIESSNVSLYYEPPALYSLLPAGNNNLCSTDFINSCVIRFSLKIFKC